MHAGKAALIAEFLTLFVILPVVFRFLPTRPSPIPFLWVLAGYCLWVLRRAPGFDRTRLWNSAPLRAALPGMLLLFLLVALGLTLVVWLRFPRQLFLLVRAQPFFWLLVMVVYPVLSVYPQGIVYRMFICERYRGLFGGATTVLLVSAAAFALSHILFRSYWSVGLTLAAGLLFAWRYQTTGSLLTSSLEHALYGCYVFSVGLGALFYHGAGRSALNG